jgi:hypothetical protein
MVVSRVGTAHLFDKMAHLTAIGVMMPMEIMKM